MPSPFHIREKLHRVLGDDDENNEPAGKASRATSQPQGEVLDAESRRQAQQQQREAQSSLPARLQQLNLGATGQTHHVSQREYGAGDPVVPRKPLFEASDERPCQEHAHAREHASFANVIPTNDPYSEQVANRNADPSHDETLSPEEPIQPDKVLSHEETVDGTTTHATPVVHETVTVNTHTIIDQPITREIHEHHIVKRILPVVQVEVKPARHFILAEDGVTKVEVPDDQTPDGGAAARRVVEAMSRIAEATNKNV